MLLIRLAAMLMAMLIVKSALADSASSYIFDSKHTDVRFTYYVGFVAQSGRFTDLNGLFLYDAQIPERGAIDIVIKTSSLSADAFETELRGSNFFNVAVFPEIRFRSRSVKPTGGNTATFPGDLTMAGITQPVELQVVFVPFYSPASDQGPAANSMPRMKATAHIKRSAFNMTAFGFLVGDGIDIQIHAALKKGKQSGF